jgi:hypothetical protein
MRVQFALLLLLGIGCTNSDDTISTLRASGYTKIEITGYEAWSCGEDATCTGFRAIGPAGTSVKGAVGCGRSWSKGCTIRLKP